LQYTPGLVITRAGGSGQSSRVSIRGSSAGQVLVLIDGVPLNGPMSGEADLSHISLETVERVTVRTGAQSARYGARAMAGVIEIQSRKATGELSALVRGGALGERNISVAAGGVNERRTFSSSASLVADYRTSDGRFSYTLPALRGAERAKRINSDATTTQVSGNAAIEGAFGTAALRGAWQRTERGLAGSIIQPSTTGRQASARLGAGLSWNGMLARVAWTAAADITREQATFTDARPPFAPPFNDSVNASGVVASTTGTITGSVATAAVGAELRTLDVMSTMLAAGSPHFQSLAGSWGNLRHSRTLSQLGIELEADLSARIDHNSLAADNVFSPAVALRMSRGLIVTSVSLGSGFAPPTLADQFFHEGVQVRANPNLRAERTEHDFQTRLTLQQTAVGPVLLGAEAAAYRSNVQGMILWLPDFRFIWSPGNYDVHRSGWDVSTKAGLPFAHFETQATFNRSDVSYAGNVLSGQVAYRPRHTASIGASFAPDIFRFDIASKFIGARRTVAGSALNMLDEYWMTDARASSQFARRAWTCNVAVGIENLFNREAAMLVDYPFPTRTWSISLRVRRTNSHSP
ncbi:MAG: TonB-dependent receptor, partial [Gemmatimonadota bacterium]|nr:TonB-dependent receptor [Gemmatimonadota bacterium]